MGNAITDEAYVALLIPDKRLTYASNLATPSQAGPKPGGAIAGSSSARLKPGISSGQDTDVDIYVSKAGNPRRHPLGIRGAAAIWSPDSGSTWYGWNQPGFLHQVDVLPTWDSTNAYSHHDLVTIPTSGKVVAIYSQDGVSDVANTAAADTRVLSPATWTWSAKVDVEANALPALNYDSCLAILPDERLLAMVMVDDNGAAANGIAWRVYYSDDEASSWTLGSSTPFSEITGPLGTVNGLARTRLLSDGTGNVLFFRNATGAAVAVQYKSVNLGLNFTQVGAAWTSQSPDFVNLLALKSGFTGFVCESNGQAIFKRIGSFSASIEAASFTVIKAAVSDAISAWVEGDGTVWVAITVTGVVELYYSLNEGSTWTHSTGVQGAGPFFSGAATTLYLPAATAFTMGGVVAVGNSVDGVAATTLDGMVWATRWGGFSNVEAGPFVWSLGVAGGVTRGLTWLPLQLPNAAWIQSTTGGTAVLTAPGMMRVATVAQTFSWNTTVYGANKSDFEGLIEIDMQSGGSVSTLQVGAEIGNGDGLNRGIAQILFSTTQYAVEDNGTARGTVTHGVSGRLQVMWSYDGTADTFSTWYKERTSETWIQGHDAVAVTPVADFAASSVRWGHTTATTSTSDWYQFHVSQAQLSSLISFDPADEQAEYLGKSITGLPYPIPQIGPDNRVAHLTLKGGPAVLGEAFTIPTEYDNGIERIFPAIHPSPTAKHRTTDTTETVLADFSPNEDGNFSTSLGNFSLFAYFEGINWRIARLEGSTDGTWAAPVVLGTFDAQIGAGIPYVFLGQDAVTIDPAGSGSHARYAWFGELVGGTVEMTGGLFEYRKIRKNTEGAFNADAMTRQAAIWLEGITGAEPPSPNTMAIWAPRGVLVVHNIGTYKRYRIVLPSQGNADGFLETGNMMIGAVHPAGRAWEYGFVTDYQPNSETETDRALVNRIRRNGKVKRTQTFGWPSPLNMTEFRNAAPNPNYLAADTGGPLAAEDDVPFWLAGLLEEIGSGETPVVVLWKMPLTDATITDPTLFMGATMTSSVGVEHATGDEGVNELERVSRITAREL